MKGRKPKPSRLHDLHGQPSRRAATKKREPVALGDLYAPPAWLTARQKAAWRYAIGHAPAGVLRSIDRSALVVWCVAQDLHRSAASIVSAEGLMNGDATRPHPATRVLDRQAALILKSCEQLSFSPVSRARLRGVSGMDIAPDPSPNAGADVAEFDRFMLSKPRLN